MSLKNDILWVEPNFVITKEGRERYQPIRQKDMVAVIPVAALRAWLNNWTPVLPGGDYDCGYLHALNDVLVELEGV